MRRARASSVARFSGLGFAAVIAASFGMRAQEQRPGDSSVFAPIAPVVEEAIARHELPGAVVLIGQGDQVAYRHAFGQRAVQPSPEPMTEDTIFDLASLTKVVATTTSVMQLVEKGRIRLHDPVMKFIPEFGAHRKSTITILHLLTHTSGLPPDLPLEVEFTGSDEAIRRASDITPAIPPGQRFIYSDINFFLLGEIVFRVSGERLDRYVKMHIFDPLEMHDTGFVPSESLRPRIAPTERCRPLAWPCGDPSSPFLRGIVHDPTARRMGNVAGHAGLFGTAADLSRFCRMLLAGGSLGSIRILSPATVDRMATPSTPAGMKDVRGLGWDIDSNESTNRGDLFPVGASFGHTGWTGTSLWLDRQTKSYVIFLSNRVHPDGKGDVSALRGQVATIAAAGLSDLRASK
jgi:CubicO group peptidase (beta-lactamase class C family)